MSNTKINGVLLNIEQLNQSLRFKLEKALSKPETSMNCSDSNTFDIEEKFYKCKRNCKSRAALFLKWALDLLYM